MISRKSFVALAASAATVPALAGQVTNTKRTGRRALVLIGGANRGAYAAGAIQALVEIQGIRDGEPLHFDMVCGSSIGALNGFMVATAQYSALAALWRGAVSSRKVFRLKPQFAAITDPQSGVLDRGLAAFRLSSGLVNNVTGILDPGPIEALLAEYVDPAKATQMPLYIATTNITTQSSQLFVRRATTSDGKEKQATNDALLATSAKHIRVATDELLHTVLFASAAIPILFDPILIPREDEPQVLDAYVDGGVTQNVPIDVALKCADTLNVILFGPPPSEVNETYDNALDIGLGMFATMQTRTLLYQLRLAYAVGKTHLPFTPYVIRPEHELPGHGADFNNQANLEAMWQLGYADMSRGWALFVPPPDLPFSSIY